MLYMNNHIDPEAQNFMESLHYCALNVENFDFPLHSGWEYFPVETGILFQLQHANHDGLSAIQILVGRDYMHVCVSTARERIINLVINYTSNVYYLPDGLGALSDEQLSIINQAFTSFATIFIEI